MNNTTQTLFNSLLALALLLAAPAWAFDSGSTGADGAFSPTADTTLSLPANGIFNFTTVNIPQGVTVTFGRNVANTPAVILAQGDVVIDGIIDISGVDGGVIAVSPPGGFDGGRQVGPKSDGANGSGPGAGLGGLLTTTLGTAICGGSGAGYGTDGSGTGPACVSDVPPGKTYGSLNLQPLLGGSGGGSGSNFETGGSSGAGGGGGGALLIAATGTLTLNGQVLAAGGRGETPPFLSNFSQKAAGGGGSGGGIRVVATTLTGNGSIEVQGGVGGSGRVNQSGGLGGYGRVRLEAETFNFTGSVLPSVALVATALPQPIFVSNLPSVTITQVDGRSVPAAPTGINDVVLPSGTITPVTVVFTAVNVPPGDTVRLTVTPTVGAIVTVTSTPLTGTLASSTATADITLPPGLSVLRAAVSF